MALVEQHATLLTFLASAPLHEPSAVARAHREIARFARAHPTLFARTAFVSALRTSDVVIVLSGITTNESVQADGISSSDELSAELSQYVAETK